MIHATHPGHVSAIASYRNHTTRAATQVAQRLSRADDASVSTVSRMRGKLAELPDVREDLVGRVRGEIAAGSYDLDSKLDAMLDDLALDLQ